MTLRHKVAGLALSLSLVIGGSQALANNQEIFAELETAAQSSRELELLEPLNVEVKTRDQLQQEMIDSMETDFPADDTADWNQVLVFLGYLEEGQNIGEIYSGLMGSQVLGYYDATTGQLVVVSTNEDEWGATDKSTYVHETVHALQDQHYDLMEIQGANLVYTDDLYFARTALIEGDATTAEIIYLVENDLVNQLIEESEEFDSSAVDEAPFFLSETLYFPYNEGAEFVMFFWTEGGWDAVNEVWQNPPTTAEQILHPEKYVEGEGAAPVAIADPLHTFGDGWRLLEYNENGELGTRVFLENGGASHRDATDASEGWGGDATYIITNDEETAMVWNTTWDTEDDAIEFFETLQESESERTGADFEEIDENTVRFEGGGYVGYIQRDGQDVIYYLAQSGESLETLMVSQENAPIPGEKPEATPQPEEATPAASIQFWIRES